MDKIKQLLREKEPKLEELISEAIKHEKANQERKDQKILEILQFMNFNNNNADFFIKSVFFLL